MTEVETDVNDLSTLPCQYCNIECNTLDVLISHLKDCKEYHEQVLKEHHIEYVNKLENYATKLEEDACNYKLETQYLLSQIKYYKCLYETEVKHTQEQEFYIKHIISRLEEEQELNPFNVKVRDQKHITKQEYVYIIHDREFIKEGRPLYRIGRVCLNTYEHFKIYPKGSYLMMFMMVTDSFLLETVIQHHFKTRFKPDTQIGEHYFEGNIEEMIEEICHLELSIKK